MEMHSRDSFQSQPGVLQNLADGIVMSGKDLADLLGVSSSTLSAAVRKGWKCAHHDVSAWATWEDDRVVGYDVPVAVVDGLSVPDADCGPCVTNPSSQPVSFITDSPLIVANGGPRPGPETGAQIGYAHGFAPNGWSPPPIPAAPAVAPVESGVVVRQLERVIEEMHKQIERLRDENERSRSTLREDNDRIRDELLRARQDHATEVRQLERKLADEREKAFEKRFELRKELMDAQTEMRLSDAGVEESVFEHVIDRYGDVIGQLLGGAMVAFKQNGQTVPQQEAAAMPNPVEAPAVRPNPVAAPPAPAPPVAVAPSVPDPVQVEAQSETVESIAKLLVEGSADEIGDLLDGLSAQLDVDDLAQLAGNLVTSVAAVAATSAEAMGVKLRAVIEPRYPLALSLPPATVTQTARTFGIASTDDEGAWLLTCVKAMQQAQNASEDTIPTIPALS